jgi:myo-inositol-1(or 4)-monophosphatase
MGADERIATTCRERLAASLACLAGRRLLAGLGDVDAIHDELRLRILNAFPDDEWFAHPADPIEPEARYVWAVGPAGDLEAPGSSPGRAFSVGVLRHGLPFAGAVYEAASGRLFTASSGWGAWLHDRPLCAIARRSRAPRMAVRGAPAGAREVVEEWTRGHRPRPFVATVSHLCELAAGDLDLVYDAAAPIVELAAAAPVVLESGAVLTREDGAPVFPLARGEEARGIAILAGGAAAHRHAVAAVIVARSGAESLSVDRAREGAA